MAGIWAARATTGQRRIVVLDGARKLGAKILVAGGGRSLPKTGSDGHGYGLVQTLGHTLTPRIFPGLVPLLLPEGHFVCELSGLSTPATLTVRAANGAPIKAFTNSTLCTHFGLSGPTVLDISRYWLDAQMDDPGATLTINWWPEQTTDSLDQALQGLGRTTLLNFLRGPLPERLAAALTTEIGLDPRQPGHSLTRGQRQSLTRAVTAMPPPVTGSRRFNYPEATARGGPPRRLALSTLEARICPRLYFCGGICGVGGRNG